MYFIFSGSGANPPPQQQRTVTPPAGPQNSTNRGVPFVGQGVRIGGS
jgi:hypothetical protein